MAKSNAKIVSAEVSPPPSTDRLAWFRDARLGMFIHWGIYSLMHNGEWVMNADSISTQDYRELAESFRAERFDAGQWARNARRAGMKYVVLTTKHHDGFCLWDTKTTAFNATRVGPKRDVVREFVDACRKEKLRVGLYWSWVDWSYPAWAKQYIWTELKEWRQPLSGPGEHQKMVEYLHAQVRELMTDYGQIDVFWFDGGFLTPEQYRSRELVDEMRRLQPGMLINDRAGFPGDFGNPEGLMPTQASDRAWELCHCSAAVTTWTAPLNDPALYAPAEELLGLLSDATGLGGNFLLNFGPEADGEFPTPSVEQLKAIREWMAKNADAIHGTEAGPTGRQEWGVSTRKGKTVYLHVFRPAAELAIRGFAAKVKSARLLGSRDAVAFSQRGAQLTLKLPRTELLPAVVALEFAGDPSFVAQGLRQRLDGSVVLPAHQAKMTTTHADAQPSLFLAPDARGGRIMGWKRIEDGVEWTFQIDKSGRFRPSIEFNNPESLNIYGRRFEISVADQSLRASVPLSGRHDRYDRYTMAGGFKLPRGEHKLTVRAYCLDPGILMNLRAVVLDPV